MNEQPQTPYQRTPVQEAMEALSPDNGGNLGDLQAVAEICIEILKQCAKDHSEEEHDDDCDFAEAAAQFHVDLCAAEALLERVGYIDMNNQEDN